MLELLGRGVLNPKYNLNTNKISFRDAVRNTLPQMQIKRAPRGPGAFGPIIQMQSPRVEPDPSSEGELSETEEHERERVP